MIGDTKPEAKIEDGATFDRWTIVRRVSPSSRYGEGYLRRRVLVRCVCGREQAVFVSDLQSGKTRGCRSLSCWAQWEVARRLMRGQGLDTRERPR